MGALGTFQVLGKPSNWSEKGECPIISYHEVQVVSSSLADQTFELSCIFLAACCLHIEQSGTKR